MDASVLRLELGFLKGLGQDYDCAAFCDHRCSVGYGELRRRRRRRRRRQRRQHAHRAACVVRTDRSRCGGRTRRRARDRTVRAGRAATPAARSRPTRPSRRRRQRAPSQSRPAPRRPGWCNSPTPGHRRAPLSTRSAHTHHVYSWAQTSTAEHTIGAHAPRLQLGTDEHRWAHDRRARTTSTAEHRRAPLSTRSALTHHVHKHATLPM